MWYIYTVGDYLAVREKEIMKLIGKLIELEMIILSEVIQTLKDKYCMFFLIYEC